MVGALAFVLRQLHPRHARPAQVSPAFRCPAAGVRRGERTPSAPPPKHYVLRRATARRRRSHAAAATPVKIKDQLAGSATSTAEK